MLCTSALCALARSRWSRTTWKDTDRKSTRLNSSHLVISYAVFCLKKKKKNHTQQEHTTDNQPERCRRMASPSPVPVSVSGIATLLALRRSVLRFFLFFFFFNDTATTEIYTLSLHDALPIYLRHHFSLVAPGMQRAHFFHGR